MNKYCPFAKKCPAMQFNNTWIQLLAATAIENSFAVIVVSGNVIAFTIGRLFKKNIATLIHKEGEKENWIIQKINQGHQIFVVAIACMVPGVPNGIIPYLSAQTTNPPAVDCASKYAFSSS